MEGSQSVNRSQNVIDPKYIPSQPILIFSKVNSFADKFQKDLLSRNVPKVLFPRVESIRELLSQKKSFIFFFHQEFNGTSPEKFIEECNEKNRKPPITIFIGDLPYREGYRKYRNMGFYGYLEMDYLPGDLDFLLEDIFELQYLRGLEENLLAVEGFRIRYNQKLEVQGPIDQVSRFTLNRLFIYNLATSLSQGSGVGSMVSLVDMMKTLSSETADGVLVDKELMNLLFENNDYTRGILDGLQNMIRIMEMTPRRIKNVLQEIFDDLKTEMDTLSSLFDNKGIKIIYPEVQDTIHLNLDEEKILMILEETLINAYKYGKANSTIEIHVERKGGGVNIIIKNKIDSDVYEGVPEEMEKILLEPFFRNHPPVEELITKNKFGLGLGLSAIDYIIQKHNGSFRIYNQKKNEEVYVYAEIHLPTLK
jgi:signal transduction histidine kinase